MTSRNTAYCARCRKVVPVLVRTPSDSTRTQATCQRCLRTWPIGAPRAH